VKAVAKPDAANFSKVLTESQRCEAQGTVRCPVLDQIYETIKIKKKQLNARDRNCYLSNFECSLVAVTASVGGLAWFADGTFDQSISTTLWVVQDP